MKPNIIIREYSSSDYQDLTNAEYPFDLEDLKSQHGWKGWISRIIYLFLGLEKKAFVAYSVDNQKAVGIVTLTKISDTIWGLWNIFVSPTHRRQGISTQLYNKSFEYLRSRKVKKAVGSVATDNIASIRGLEKTWNRFISQKFHHYSGKFRATPASETEGIIIRNFHPTDIKALFQIYNACATEDWKRSLEITEKNFLDRFIGNIYGKGIWRLLFRKQILIAEHNEKIVGYVITTRTRFVQKDSDAATLFIFFNPQLSEEVTISSIRTIISTLVTKGVKTLSLYALADNENTVEQIMTNLNTTPLTLMVPIIELRLS